MKLGELFYDLGFHADETKLDDFIKMVGDLDMKSLFAAAGWGALGKVIANTLNNTKDIGMEMYQFGMITGMSAVQMNSWSRAAKQAGVEGKTVEETFKRIQMVQEKAKIGQMDSSFFQGIYMLNKAGAGINIFDKPAVMQEKLVKGIEKMDDGAKRLVMSLMGVNEEMLVFYKSPEFAKRNENAIGGEEMVSKMREMNAEWVKLGQEFERIGAEFSTEIAPAIIGTTRTLLELVKEIKNSFIGKTLSMSAEGWGKVGEWTAFGLDEMTTNLAKFAVNNFKDTPGFQTAPTVNATFHFSHVMSADEIAKHTKFALSEAVREANTKLPPKGY